MWWNGKLSWDKLRRAAEDTAKVTVMLYWLFFGSSALIGVYTLAGGTKLIQDAMTTLPVGPIGVVIFIQIIWIILGCFIDWIGILLLTAPIFIPVVIKLGFDPVWMGVLFCMNMQISYISPPFGPAAFYLKGVTPPGITLADIFGSIWPYMAPADRRARPGDRVPADRALAARHDDAMRCRAMRTLARRRSSMSCGCRRPVIPGSRCWRSAPLDPARDEPCEILIAGGGTGGVAAALAAARAGRRVVLLEETDWLGGQMTAQGVSALDEHEHIEAFGGTASYYRVPRDAARPLSQPARKRSAGRPDFNPGDCWVTRLAFEPAVAVGVIERMLQPHVAAGRLVIHRRMKVVAATTEGDRVTAVVARGLDDDRLIRFHPELVIDATELGDLLPLCGAEHVVGAETIDQTGERQAQPQEPKPHCVQSFTYTFACERRDDGESHVIPRPEKYEHYRSAQPYSLRIEVHGGEIYGEQSGWLEYRLYDRMPGTKGGLWTYRRLLDRARFARSIGHDVTMFNWPGNDYRDRSILDCAPIDAARALQDAKRVSLGFLHWLQTEAPATGERRGAPEIRLRPDVMGNDRWPLEASVYPRVAPHQGAQDDRRAGSVSPSPAGAARRRTSRTRSASAGIRSTSTAPARRTSARAAAPSRSRSRSGRCCRSASPT